MFIILDCFICNSLQCNIICTNIHIKKSSYVLDIIDCMNIQYLNCSEVIVITISHVHRIELLGISNFNHIFFLDVKDVNTMVIHIYCQYTTLIVCCDTVVYTLDPSLCQWCVYSGYYNRDMSMTVSCYTSRFKWFVLGRCGILIWDSQSD